MGIGHGPGVCTEDGDSAGPETQAATTVGPLEQGPFASKSPLPFSPVRLSSNSRGHRT